MKKKICRKIMAVALTGLVFAVSILPGFASSGYSDAGNPEMNVITASAVGGNGGQTAGGEVGGSAAIDSPANGIDGDTNSMIPGAGGTTAAGDESAPSGDESAGNAAAEEDKLNSNPDAGNNLTNGGDNAANDTDMTGEMEENANDMTKSTNWAAIIIAIVIAVALVAVIVALIPKKRSDS